MFTNKRPIIAKGTEYHHFCPSSISFFSLEHAHFELDGGYNQQRQMSAPLPRDRRHNHSIRSRGLQLWESSGTMPNQPNVQIWPKILPQAQWDHFHILPLQLSFELSYISSLPLLTAENY